MILGSDVFDPWTPHPNDACVDVALFGDKGLAVGLCNSICFQDLSGLPHDQTTG